MIGTGDKDYTEKCWKHATELGIRENIVYQEKMEQKYLSDVYNLADFFLLPTKYEIFGMVLLEAMYYKTVVLTTDNGGSSTLIDNGRNGYILQDENASKWANVVSEVTSEKLVLHISFVILDLPLVKFFLTIWWAMTIGGIVMLT